MRMSFVGSIAANAQNDNVLSGKLHEFLGEHSRIVLAATGSATGSRLSLLIGGGSRGQGPEDGAGHRLPQPPPDVVPEGAGVPSDPSVIPRRKTTTLGNYWQVAV